MSSSENKKNNNDGGGSGSRGGGNRQQYIWKHIGLHGHSVGTIAFEEERIIWRSAISGGGGGRMDDDEQDVMSTSTRTIPKDKLQPAGTYWTVFGKSGHLRIQTKQPNQQQQQQNNGSNTIKHEFRFDGFPYKDYELLRDILLQRYDINLQPLTISSSGTQYGISSVKGKNLIFRHCVLDDMNEEGQEFEPRIEDEMLSVDLAEVSQCVLPGNNRNEIEVQFPESDTVEAGTDQLVAIRFYIPPDPDSDPADKVAPTAAERLQAKIMSTASIRKTTGDIIVRFEETKGTFLTPRGRYSIELYDIFLRMRGQKYDYKIKYDDINRLFLLPKPDEVHMAFVIALDKPIRQGQQRYQYLVLQATKEPDEVVVNCDEETLQKEYDNELQPVMRGSLSNLIAKTFKIITRKKVFIPGKYANASQQPCVKCAVRANEGLLYPLEKQFVFIHKPPLLIRFNEVDSVEFQRYAGGQGSTRNFDLCINLKSTTAFNTATGTAAPIKDYTFSGIDRSDYSSLYNFISSKKIPITNLEGGINDETTSRPTNPVYNEDEIYGGPDDDANATGGGGAGGEDEEESEDEDYDEAAAAKDAEKGGGSRGSDDDDEDASDDMDSDEMGSEIDDDLDSDLEELRNKDNKKPAAVKKKKKKGDGDDNDDGDDERAKKKAKKSSTKSPPAAAKKKKGEDSDDDDDDDSDDGDDKKKKATNSSKTKKKKKKDPNAPKKAITSYFYYMSENRERIKKENPDAAFGDVTKILGNEWKNLSTEAKQKFEKMAEKDKIRYQQEMKNYVPPSDNDDDDDDDNDGSDDGKKKKKKRAKKDPNAPKRALTSFFIFSNEMRPKLKEENPGIGIAELGKKLGQLYKKLSNHDKEKYNQLANKDKERYAKQMKEYKNKKGNDDDDNNNDDDDDDED